MIRVEFTTDLKSFILPNAVNPGYTPFPALLSVDYLNTNNITVLSINMLLFLIYNNSYNGNA